MDRNILKYSLYLGSLYFFSISVAHILGAKVPGLFIYYNIPSHQYQDSIIAFLSFGWAVFFHAAAREPAFAGTAVMSAVVAVLGLVHINLTSDFSLPQGSVERTSFWYQIVVLAAYVIWLLVFYILTGIKNRTVSSLPNR